jgi:hypothetical protein
MEDGKTKLSETFSLHLLRAAFSTQALRDLFLLFHLRPHPPFPVFHLFFSELKTRPNGTFTSSICRDDNKMKRKINIFSVGGRGSGEESGEKGQNIETNTKLCITRPRSRSRSSLLAIAVLDFIFDLSICYSFPGNSKLCST